MSSDTPTYRPLQRTPPKAERFDVPRAAWSPPRRAPEGKHRSAYGYEGHYRPSQFMPNYAGGALGTEVEKARAYYDKNVRGQSGMPDLVHNSIQRPFPVYSSPEMGGGDYAFFTGRPWGGSSPDLRKNYYRNVHHALGPSEGLVNIKRKPDEAMSDSDVALLDSLNRAGGRMKSTMSSPESLNTLQHEMRHAWTLGDMSKLRSLDEDPVTRMLNEKVEGKEEDSPKGLFSELRGPTNKIEAYHPGAVHGLSKDEQIGWLSGLQHELYGERGRRLETPEEANTYLRRMINLPENEFEKEVAGFESDAARGLRHLRVLNHGNPDLWEAEGQVSPDAPTSTYRENPVRLPRSGWLGPLSGKAIPLTGDKTTKPNPYNQGKEIAPELLEQYIQWLSKLAPALVSTQNGNQNIMKTASTSPKPPTPGGWVDKGRNWNFLTSGIGARNLDHPDLLETGKLQKANPLARVVPREESNATGKNWNEVYNRNVKGTYLNEHDSVETRSWAPGFGQPIPKIYGGMQWRDNPQSRGYYYGNMRMAPISDFIELANRIRPSGFRVKQDGRAGRTYGATRKGNALGDYLMSGGSMSLGDPISKEDGSVAIHELEHTMQSNKLKGDKEWVDRRSVMETPAVIAGAAADARASVRDAQSPEEQERINNSQWTLPPNPETGALRRGLSAKTMARQYDKWGYGNNRQGQQVRPAQTMTELLSTPEGQNYLKLLNSEIPGSAPSELERFLDRDKNLRELRERRQAELDMEYRHGEYEREGKKVIYPDGTSARDSALGDIDYFEKKLRDAERSKKASDLITSIKLAPALVSTQNGDQNIMKTASYAPTDMTKEADIGQLLSGLGGHATNFINNMPSNPSWQNGLAGGGGAGLLMLLLNLLTGNKMGRGMLPAMLTGGALGAGMPAFYNYLNRPGGYRYRQDESKSGPPTPPPEFGPPARNQEFDGLGRIRTLTPLQMKQRERQKKVVPGTLGEIAADVANKKDEVLWSAGGPARGVAHRFNETAKNADKLGWWNSLMLTPYKDTFKDPHANAEKYSAPDFR